MSGLIDHATLLREIDYDPATGVIVWRVAGSGRYTEKRRKRIAGSYWRKRNSGLIQIKRVRYTVPRIAFFYMTGRWPKRYVVHKNGDSSNNRWSNLMEADTPRAGISKSSIYESVTWRTEEDQVLIDMVRAGKTLTAAADVLGRSVGGVKFRWRKLKRSIGS